jgi:hypothetical protein
MELRKKPKSTYQNFIYAVEGKPDHTVRGYDSPLRVGDMVRVLPYADWIKDGGLTGELFDKVGKIMFIRTRMNEDYHESGPNVLVYFEGWNVGHSGGGYFPDNTHRYSCYWMRKSVLKVVA